MPSVSEEMDAQKELLAGRWHRYGQRFDVIVPEEQPYPSVWDRELPEADEKGRLSPQALKHLRYLFSLNFACDRKRSAAVTT